MEFSEHGTISPYLDVELGEGERILAESGSLVAKAPSVQMSTRLSGGMAGALKRLLGGTSLFIVEYQGPGQVTLTHGRSGRLVPLELDGSRVINVASRAFVCCEDGVAIDLSTARDAELIWAQTPLFMLRFSGRGKAFAFAEGDLKELHLGRGESIDVAPGRVVYLEGSVRVRRSEGAGVLDVVLGGSGASLARLTGPGMVCLQTRNAIPQVHSDRRPRRRDGSRPPRPPRPSPDDEQRQWLWDDHRSD